MFSPPQPSILTQRRRRHPVMSLLMHRCMLHIQQTRLANECNKWAAAVLTRRRRTARAAEKRLLRRRSLRTSIYPFIFRPVPGWKMWKECMGCRGGEESLTNASLDARWGHSSPLSPGHSAPPPPPTPDIRCMHSLHLAVADTVVYCTAPKQGLCLLFQPKPFSAANKSIRSIKSCFLHLLTFEFNHPLHFSTKVIIQPVNVSGLPAWEAYGYSRYTSTTIHSPTHTQILFKALIDSLDLNVD